MYASGATSATTGYHSTTRIMSDLYTESTITSSLVRVSDMGDGVAGHEKEFIYKVYVDSTNGGLTTNLLIIADVSTATLEFQGS